MNKMVIYKCETPLHAGSGSELGIVDMPIQREVHTGFPKVEASGIKGVFRREYITIGDSYKKFVDILFGPEDDGSEHAGCLEFTDARILLFPVKSAKGIFAWITCPFVIKRFINDLNIMGINDIKINMEGIEPSEDTAVILDEDNKNKSNLIIREKDDNSKKEYILLEEFGYSVSHHENVFRSLIDKIKLINKENEKYITSKIDQDIVIVNDEVFNYFVNMSTEVDTRIRIGDNGVVKDGALFTEEYLPSETIMYSFINLNVELTNNVIKNLDYDSKISLEYIEGLIKEHLDTIKTIQLGGNKNIGKGIVSLYPIELNVKQGNNDEK